MSRQRLILLFDGTWNDPSNCTHVYRLARRLHEYAGDIHQRAYYSPGVGTGRFQKLLGGLTGFGLNRDLMQGYQWLAEHHQPGDEIWLFGFSRGAYTARSLAGLLRKCGLLRATTPARLREAQRLYRNRAISPQHPLAEQFRRDHSKTPRVNFIGVWDTVGALGVPGTLWSERRGLAWHDTELSSIVDYAYQALAIDEHRKVYDAPLWTSCDGACKRQQREVEQRWFIGAHGNVGGSYGVDDPLAALSLAWMLEKATAVGLALEPYQAPAEAHLGDVADPYHDFLLGLYPLWRRLRAGGDGRHHRALFGTAERRAVNVSLDPSIWRRWQARCDYRPGSLLREGLRPPKPCTDPRAAANLMALSDATD